MKGNLILKEQEVEGEFSFTRPPKFVGKQFSSLFNYEITDSMNDVIGEAIRLIEERYGGQADCFQVFIYESRHGEKTKFYCIHDITHITFVLPEER